MVDHISFVKGTESLAADLASDIFQNVLPMISNPGAAVGDSATARPTRATRRSRPHVCPAPPRGSGGRARFTHSVVYVLLVSTGILAGLLVVEVAVRVFHLTRDTSPLLLYADPAFGYAYKPNQSSRSLFGIQFTTNAAGLRDRDYTAYSPPTTRRIIVLGDSVTMGYGVPQEATFSKQLETEFGTDTEVINAGIEGFNIHNEEQFYRKIARRYHPREVLLVALSNDAQTAPRRVPYISPQGIPTTHTVGTIPLWLRYAMHKSATAVFLLDVLQARPTPPMRPTNEEWAAFERALVRLSHYVRRDGASFKIVFFPSRAEAESPRLSTYVTPRLADLARARKLAFYDLTKDLARYLHSGRDPYLSHDSVHPNADGHRLIAERLAKFLRLPGRPAETVVHPDEHG